MFFLTLLMCGWVSTVPAPVLSPNSFISSYSTQKENRDERTRTVVFVPLLKNVPATPAANALTGTDFSIAPGPQPSDEQDLFFIPQPSKRKEATTNCPESRADWKKSQASAANGISSGIAQLQNTVDRIATSSRTVADDENAPTAVIALRSTTTPSITYEKNGDVLLHLDKDFADRLNELISRISSCAKKRSPSSGCIQSVDLDLFGRIQNGVAAPLALLHDEVPVPMDPAAQGILQGIYVAGMALPPPPGPSLEPGSTRPLLRLGFYLINTVAEGKTIGSIVRIGSKSEFKASKDCPLDLPKCFERTCKGVKSICTLGINAGCACTNDCPPDDRIPVCVNCGGQDGKSAMCKGILKADQLFWAECKCSVDTNSEQRYNQAEVKKTQQIFSGLKPKSKKVDFYCSGTRNVGLTMDVFQFPEVVNEFCKGIDLKKKLNKSVLATIDGKRSFVDFTWAPRQGLTCVQTCFSIFRLLLTQENCFNYARKTVAQHAALIHRCGAAHWVVHTEDPSGYIPKPVPISSPMFQKNLTLGDLSCHHDGIYESTHDAAKIPDQSQIFKFAQSVCAIRKTMQDGDAPLRWQVKSGLHNDIPYGYEISWRPGCNTTVESQDVMYPLPDNKIDICPELFIRSWRLCKSNGLTNFGDGGYQEAGCMRYDFFTTEKEPPLPRLAPPPLPPRLKARV